jgi:phosphotransferase system  glucose/maltose/N-acetylglucosamine-specific IIC component
VFELIVGCQNTLMRLTGRAMIMTYLMLAYYVLSLGVLSYLLGFVVGMKVPGMVLAFVIVSAMLNCNYFVVINFRTKWENLHTVDEHGGQIDEENENTRVDIGDQYELANGEKK